MARYNHIKLKSYLFLNHSEMEHIDVVTLNIHYESNLKMFYNQSEEIHHLQALRKYSPKYNIYSYLNGVYDRLI